MKTTNDLAIERKSGSISCIEQRPKGRQRSGKIHSYKKRTRETEGESFRNVLIENCWHGEAGARITKINIPVIGQGSITVFFQLVLNLRYGQNLGKLSVIHQVLATWEHSL